MALEELTEEQVKQRRQRIKVAEPLEENNIETSEDRKQEFISGTVDVEYESLGRFSTPAKLSFKDYSTMDINAIVMSTPDKLVKTLVPILNGMICGEHAGKFDVSNMTVEEFIETLVAVKGKFNSITTNAGQKISEHLPKLAKHGEKMAVINSMMVTTGAHEQAQYLQRTSFKKIGTIVHPNLGAWMCNFKDNHEPKVIPENVLISGPADHPGAGWMPKKYAPIPIADPVRGLDNTKIKNVDEFNRTTAGAVEKVGGAKKGKAIIIINPAEPPLIMRDTVHCLVEGEPNREAITASIHAMIGEVQKYVPGYRLVNGPVFDGNRVSVFLEVEGLGDFLPTYAGNLDIMTAAAARTAEMFAEEILAGRLTLSPATVSGEPRLAGCGSH